jgi:methionyl aminopeptidase
MIDFKTPEQIEIMKTGGRMLGEVMAEITAAVRPGVTELEIDRLAEKLIRGKGGEPGFMRVEGYKYAVCMSTNDVVVHGIPGKYVFKEGDLVGIDCGVYYKGYHTDMSESVIAQNPGYITPPDVAKFMKVGKDALNAAIKMAQPGNRIGHISKTIQDMVEKEAGYAIVRSLIGHGVGRELHEEPEVPGYLATKIEKTPLLKPGMTIAVEVIYNMGGHDVVLDRDGWTIRTADGALAGLYERSIAITENGPVMLTPWDEPHK